ncbi:MAG TPA: protein kinase [Gammaproteobacteria bacterium]
MAGDAERLARFDREAKTLASLNHPNIGQIYGLEESDGATALILELVEGPTLADRIAEGPLSVDDTLSVALQIADALEAAHSQGIVHRDLKPANVKLRPDGTVKVLDFGISKALESENLASGLQSPVLTTPVTQAGVILGTAAYMSPEQAKGQPVDQRADVWAFGCVVYEMLTGQMAFGAEDVPTTLARVIANEPSMGSLPAAVSPALRQTIELCLQKDVRKRLHAIGDARLALEGAFETVPQQLAQDTAQRQPIWRRALPVAAAVVLTGVVVGPLDDALWPEPAPGPLPVTRFDFDLPEGQTFREFNRNVIEVSPDGRHFVYNTSAGLYLRMMDEIEPRLITGTEASSSGPTYSPDGLSVVYADGSTQQLKRIAISGGAPVVIAGAGDNPYAISWSADDSILFQQIEGVYRVPATGGTPELLIEQPEDEQHFGPRLLPDGDSVLFTVLTDIDWDSAQVVLQSLSTGERTVLVEGGADARYLPTGHIVYALGDGLFAVRFDLDTKTVYGGAVPLVQGLMRGVGGGAAAGAMNPMANYSVSGNGTLVYVAGDLGVAESTLVWVDRGGREEPLAVTARVYTYPRISPDGTRVALDVRDRELDIWIWDFERQNLLRWTFGPEQDEFPVWTPNGQRIVFNTAGGRAGTIGGSRLNWRASDGTGQVETLAESAFQLYPSSVLPDGSGILVRTNPNIGDDVGIVWLNGEGDVTPLLDTPFNELNGEISPDGLWLAYTSDESGSNEVYVRPFPDVDGGGLWQVSTDGGRHPAWSRDGEELFYRSGDALMAVAIEYEPSFAPGNPEVLFEGPYFGAAGGRTYDVSPNGERFLMIKRIEGTTAVPQIIVVQNWFEELERLAPPIE